MGLQDPHLVLESGGPKNVVGIQPGDIPAPGVPLSQVSGFGHAPVLVSRMLEIPDLAGPVLGVPFRDLRAPVGGSVLHEKKLPEGVGLRDHAFDRFGEKFFGIQDGDGNGNDGLPVLRVQ